MPKAVWVSNSLNTEIKEVPIWEPADDEILIKNVAVASNPKDYKVTGSFLGHGPRIEGNDVAGHVVTVGKNVTKFKKGDRVAAFTIMSVAAEPIDKYGAYAEYSVSPAITAFHIGPDYSFEDASAFPLAFGTAVIGLWPKLEVPYTPENPCKDSTPLPILIWGASTTVGVYAVQLAKLSGLYVFGIAGSSIELAKSMGVDEVIDYRGKTLEQLQAEIAQLAKEKNLRYIFDTVSDPEIVLTCARALAPHTDDGRVCGILPQNPKETAQMPKNVFGTKTEVHTAYGVNAAISEMRYDKLGSWLSSGTPQFRPQKVTIVPGGLDGIAEGLRRLSAGEVKGEKLVYRISETSSLSL